MITTKLYAHDVKIDGIFYDLEPTTTVEPVGHIRTATVTASGSSLDGTYSGSVVIPKSIIHNGETYTVTTIGKSAFAYCYSVTSITIPESVTTIEERAFYDCRGLTSITIPESVTSIGMMAFNMCMNLSTITLPNNITTIESATFQDCSSLASIAIPSNVTTIDQSAFSHCSSLSSVTIPNSVTSIGQSAFASCTGLTSVYIPQSVTSIGEDAFYECSGLTSVQIQNLAAWCRIDFSNSSANPLTYAHHLYLNGEEVKDLVIPDGVKDIGSCAFYCCNLTSVTIPQSMENIGDWAFYACDGLTSVHTQNLAAWCRISFSGNTSNPLYYAHHLYLNGEEVKDLVIPESITTIKDWAFYRCTGITSVDIPASVTSICYGAFWYCLNLNSIRVHWDNPLDWGVGLFDSEVRKKGTLYVPKGSKERYMGYYGWKEFTNIQELADGADTPCITIRMGDGGVLKQSVEKGRIYTYTVCADEGWEVNTLTFDGEDMTAQLQEGRFYTPAITGDSELNVVFRQTSTGVKDRHVDTSVKVYANGNSISVKGTDTDTPISVYSTNGSIVTSAIGNAVIPLGSGIYIVKVGTESFKVAL